MAFCSSVIADKQRKTFSKASLPVSLSYFPFSFHSLPSSIDLTLNIETLMSAMIGPVIYSWLFPSSGARRFISFPKKTEHVLSSLKRKMIRTTKTAHQWFSGRLARSKWLGRHQKASFKFLEVLKLLNLVWNFGHVFTSKEPPIDLKIDLVSFFQDSCEICAAVKLLLGMFGLRSTCCVIVWHELQP